MALSFLQGTDDGTNATTYTFSAQNLGVAASDRYIIVAAQCRAAVTNRTLSSVTIGGVSATIVLQATNPAAAAACCTGAIVIAAVPTGTTGDIVVTWNGEAVRCAIQAYRVTSLSSSTASDSDSYISDAGDPSVNLDVPANGFAIGAGISGSSSGGPVSWTGLTEDYDAQIAGEVSWATSASDSFVSAQTGLTITIAMGTKVEQVGVFASWAFASTGDLLLRLQGEGIFGGGLI